MKIVAITGNKNNGQKTLIKKVINELSQRGFKVGALMKNSHHNRDLKGTFTSKYHDVDATIVSVEEENETFFLLNHETTLNDMIKNIECLINLDFLILEGYEDVNYAKIATSPRNDPFTFAQIDPNEINEDSFSKILDLIEKRSFAPLANLDCGECGYASCEDMALAVIKGKVTEESCVIKRSSDMILAMNGKKVPLNPFVKKFVKNTILGMLNSLKKEDEGEITKIELFIEDHLEK